MADKNYDAMLKQLRPHVTDPGHVVFTKVPGSRSKEPSELQKLWPGARVAATPRDAIDLLRAESRPEDTVLICGSLYLVGDARAMLE
jgi:folylpolyglutamate synthase/dihydropteroate synthase